MTPQQKDKRGEIDNRRNYDGNAPAIEIVCVFIAFISFPDIHDYSFYVISIKSCFNITLPDFQITKKSDGE